MPNQARVVKVLALLLASMTIGAIVLMTLGHEPPKAGPFSLYSFYLLEPVKETIFSHVSQIDEDWNKIEICYSGTKSGNIEDIASYRGFSDSGDVDFHFCVYNGSGGSDGQIQSTEKWQQQSICRENESYDGDKAIRICIVADGRNTRPTDCQIKRIQVLVEELRRSFDIKAESVFYPNEWR